jgi:hypothetical protein
MAASRPQDNPHRSLENAMRLSLVLRIVASFLSIALLATAAQAQLFRAYVAPTGSDGNPCTLAAPCRLLPAALNAVASGGEIWMLDSANYNTSQVNITKSVSILAVPGAVGSVVATGGGDGININTAGVKVSLRNLVIVHLTSSTNGISFLQGAELNVTDCEIANVANAGIYAAAAGGKVNVRNTQLRGAGNFGFWSLGTVVASLDAVQAKGNFYGMVVDNGSRVTITNSVATGNGHSGVFAQAPSGGTTKLAIDNTVLTGNVLYGLATQTFSAADVVEISVSRSTITNNISAGIAAGQFAGSAQTILVSDSLVTSNGTGVYFVFGTPIIYTRGNNTVELNGTDVSGGTLTARAAK